MVLDMAGCVAEVPNMCTAGDGLPFRERSFAFDPAGDCTAANSYSDLCRFELQMPFVKQMTQRNPPPSQKVPCKVSTEWVALELNSIDVPTSNQAATMA